MSLKIAVFAKQVPDTSEVKIDPVKFTLIRDGVESIMNHDDLSALEVALRIKDKDPDTHITVITMGPMQAKSILQNSVARGADEGVLLSDRALGGSDTWATSNALAAAARKLGPFDIIFAGRQAIDGDTAQVGPQLAEKLDLPQVTYVRHFELDGDNVIVKRAMEDGYELIRVPMPCVLTVIKEINEPRHMTMKGVALAAKKEIKVLNAEDIEVDLDTVGLDASPTNVIQSFTPIPKGKGIILHYDTAEETAKALVEKLSDKFVVS